ncbi:MAG: MarR family winged helix-turn-helix transcriptional regulator [Candidatus Dormibacteria bacterium]
MSPSQLSFDPIAEARRQWDARWDAGASMAASTSVMRVQQIVLARVDAVLRELGLNFARYEVLVLLHFSRRGSLPMGKMGERLMIHPTSVTNLVDRLEEAGLVRRTAHPSDGRTTLAAITPAGRRLVERATTRVTDVHLGLQGLDARELDQLSARLRKVRLDAGDYAPVTSSTSGRHAAG